MLLPTVLGLVERPQRAHVLAHEHVLRSAAETATSETKIELVNLWQVRCSPFDNKLNMQLISVAEAAQELKLARWPFAQVTNIFFAFSL
jgi:hypothetical protein